ncbi:29002_t:CDS:2, partial [Gigaspora margarita]
KTDKLPASINVTINTSQANSTLDNERINDNQEDYFVSDDDSPGWSECDDCYRNKKEFCKFCSCSVCDWKGDRGHILLYDGSCGKNFHTRCQKPLLTRIPAGNWYYSDNKDVQNIRNFSKKKTTNRSKKQETFSDPLEKSILHNNSAINDSTKNRVESTNFLIVIVEEDERFSSRQQIDETENVSATQSDNNIRESFTQLDNFRSSTSLHSVNHSIDEIEDNTSDEDKEYSTSGHSLPVPMEIEEGDDIESQIKTIWKKISNNRNDYQYSRELKNSGQFFIPGFITVVDQVTGEKKQEINPKANN